MPLNKAALKSGIKNLILNIAENEGSYDDFANGLGDLIDTYVKTGLVTVALGIPVATTGSAAAQTGATTATGTGTIS
ncbi:MAG: hypothetical protein ACOYN4_00705 [Bacteroidales bacterium]